MVRVMIVAVVAGLESDEDRGSGDDTGENG